MNAILCSLVGVCLALGGVLPGSTNPKTAHQLAKEGVALVEQGRLDDAVPLLEEANKLEPDNLPYAYELSFAYCGMKDYKKAITILERLTPRAEAVDRVFELLGNCWDFQGQPEKAVEVYQQGLKRFPNSGCLHLELGVLSLHKKEMDKALSYFEKGIEAAPAFPSNYYWAAKLYLNSPEMIWGLIYGEIFMNLERNSPRTAEISALLFQGYQKGVTLESPTQVHVKLTQTTTMVMGQGKSKIPFGLGVYEPCLAFSLVSEKKVDLDSLDRVRKRFLDLYYQRKFDRFFPIVLFEYQRSIDQAGHFAAYNHWILMKGDEKAFSQWQEANSAKWEAFLQWFGPNQLVLNEKHRTYRRQYD